MANDRISQLVTEVLVVGDPKARNSQLVTEVLSAGNPTARVSQLTFEALCNAIVLARTSQFVVEVLTPRPTQILASASNTIAFTQSTHLNPSPSVSNTITFVGTGTFNLVSVESGSNTIVLNHSVALNIVNAIDASNTIVFDHSVAYDFIGASGSIYTRDADNTITFADSATRNIVDLESVSSTVAFVGTATRNIVDLESVASTISFSHSVTIRIPIVVHPRNTITLGQSVSCTRVRNRDASNTLTVTGIARRIITLSVSNTASFSQTEDEDYCHVALSDLVLDEDVDVDKFITRTAFSNPAFTQNTLVNTVLNLSAVNSIVLTDVTHRVLEESADNTIVFTQIVVGVASKNVISTEIFTQSVALTYVFGRSVEQFLGFFEDVVFNKTINKRMRNIFNINQHGRILHLLNKTASNNVSFGQDLVRERFLLSTFNTLVPYQSILHTHIHNKIASNTISFSNNVAVNTVIGLRPSNTINFSLPYRKPIRIGDLTEIEIPPAIGTVIKQGYIYDCNNYPQLTDRKKNLMVLSVAEQSVVLPASLFGDRIGNTDTFTMSYGMTGVIYTTTKKSETKAFSFEWDISVRKAEELAGFLFTYNTRAIKILTWQGEIWIARLMSNPIQLTDQLRTADCDSKVLVALDFEGLRIH